MSRKAIPICCLLCMLLAPGLGDHRVWAAMCCEGEEPDGPPPDEGDFCSQTQGGWGTTCMGHNPGCLFDTYFDDILPYGLIVGDPDGPDDDDCHAIELTSSAAVQDYLSAVGAPAALTADHTDPQNSSAGVFGGQLVAATLNLGFDEDGLGLCSITDSCDFSGPPGTLGELIYVDCVADSLLSLTVSDVIGLANCAIQGCNDLQDDCGAPAGVTISDLNDALDKFNNEFIDCTHDGDCLSFANMLSITVDANPNQIQFGGTSQLSVMVFGGTPPYTYAWTPGETLDDVTIHNPVATPFGSTTYTVEVTDAEGIQVSGDVQVTVTGGLLACFTITPENAMTFEPVFFDAACSQGTIVSYSWWFDYHGDPNELPTVVSPDPISVAFHEFAGTFETRLVVEDDLGNQAEEIVTLVVTEP